MDISVRQFNDLADMILNTHVEKENGQCNKITIANKAGSTSRPVQNLNGRNIDKICPSHFLLSPSGTPTPPPTTTPTCDDSPLPMLVNSKNPRTCAWLTDSNKSWQCANSFIREHCPSTCNGDCSNVSQIRFEVGDRGFKSCEWVARFYTAFRCALDGVKETCRKTCSGR